MLWNVRSKFAWAWKRLIFSYALCLTSTSLCAASPYCPVGDCRLTSMAHALHSNTHTTILFSMSGNDSCPIHNTSNAMCQKYPDVPVAFCRMQTSLQFWLFWPPNPLHSGRSVTWTEPLREHKLMTAHLNKYYISLWLMSYIIIRTIYKTAGHSSRHNVMMERHVPIVYILQCTLRKSSTRKEKKKYAIWNAAMARPPTNQLTRVKADGRPP